MASAQSIDVRAHYSASSAKANDTCYQHQAAAYVSFVITRRQCLSNRLSAALPCDDIGSKPVAAANLLDDTQAALQVLHSRFSSSIEEGQQLRVLCSEDTQSRSCEVQAEGSPNMSVVLSQSSAKHSSHLHSPVMLRGSKRRKPNPPRHHDPLQSSGQSREARASDDISCNLLQPHCPGQVELARTTDEQAFERLQPDTSSELPTSYSLSEMVSSPPNVSPRSLQRSTSDPGPAAAQKGHVEHAGRALQSGAAPAQVSPAVATTATTTATGTTEGHPDAAKPDEIVERQANLLEESCRLVQGPPPSPGIGTFKTHITDRLRLLAESPKLRDAYNVTCNTRPLTIHERGQWSFSITSWHDKLKMSFWMFLEEFINGNGAGWGVLCSWTSALKQGEKDLVQVFCWGEIAMHTYLLLYVASQGKLGNLTANWIASDGTVILQAGCNIASKP